MLIKLYRDSTMAVLATQFSYPQLLPTSLFGNYWRRETFDAVANAKKAVTVSSYEPIVRSIMRHDLV
jgi:hypothetical protein